LIVEDAGLGISPALLPFIFDTFTQADRTLDRAGGGLGIGLTLVRRLVEMHGGTVEASSKGEGHGSRFTVRLRQIPAADGSAVVSSALDRAECRRVLLIDDSPDAREMLRMMLELEGHVVFDAADGVRGLALLEVEHPDVAIIDIGLPGLDGHQIARRIREGPTGDGMLLLALTGYGFADDYQRSADAGFDHHLVKPVDVGALSRLLRTRSGRIVETDA
jgi:CheY-like chemotaxis protein